MTTNLYVGNLSYDTTEDTLRGLFADFGEIVSVRVITDRYSGRSKGFAFVEMSSDEAAQGFYGLPASYEFRELRPDGASVECDHPAPLFY